MYTCPDGAFVDPLPDVLYDHTMHGPPVSRRSTNTAVFVVAVPHGVTPVHPLAFEHSDADGCGPAAAAACAIACVYVESVPGVPTTAQ
jgi:hypothetical protein